MGYVVTFSNYTPPPKYQGGPYTEVKIEEAPANSGPWTVLETQEFDVPDADPENPEPRSFTTQLATLQAGWYRVTFIDADGDGTIFNPVKREYSQYAPTVEQVAGLLRNRTVDSNNNYLGTFTDKTTPTRQAAESLIRDAVIEAYPSFGSDIPDAPGSDPDALRVAATRTVAYRAAVLIEESFFSQDVSRGNSPADRYQESWAQGLKRVASAIDSQGGNAPGGDAEGTMFAEFVFAEDDGGMIGWGTRW